MTIVDKIIDYEEGLLTEEEIVDLFQILLDTGLVYELQGHYQRFMAELIREGLVTT